MDKKELYKKHRPRRLDQMVGQEVAVRSLKSFAEKDRIPHAILFTGPSGCGKTTLARIIRRSLRCSRYDFIEDAPRKIEDVRGIKLRINQAPLRGKRRVWLIDEAHKLTPDAQDEFLKMLEDTPKHVYFLFTTTIPEKLKKTIRNRCTEITVKPLSDKDLTDLIGDVCAKENTIISNEVIDKIIDNSDGSARKALVFLNGIINLESEKEQLNAIVTATAESQAIEIARALFNTHTKWKGMTKILKETEGEEPEQIRWLVLRYAKSIILKSNNRALIAKAYLVMDAFCDNFYDSKMSGLVIACYEVIEGGKEI